MEFLRLLLSRHFEGKLVVASQKVACFLEAKHLPPSQYILIQLLPS